MFRKLLLTLTLAVPCLAIVGQPSAPKHLDEAVKLLEDIKPDTTSYRHKDNVVKWKGENGAVAAEAHTDCSGFINSLILHSYPQYTADALKKWLGKPRPTADSYYEAMVAQKGFTRITKIDDIQPGDMIAMKYPPGSGNTGHIVVVRSPPRPRAASAPLVAGTDQWEVSIIDSSMSGHGKTDTRRKDDGTYRNGLGSGILRLYSKSGIAIGYSWSVLAASEFNDGKTKPMAIGRLDLKFQPDVGFTLVPKQEYGNESHSASAPARLSFAGG